MDQVHSPMSFSSSDSDDIDDSQLVKLVQQKEAAGNTSRDKPRERVTVDLSMDADDDDGEDEDDTELLKATEAFRSQQKGSQIPNGISFNVGTKGSLVPIVDSDEPTTTFDRSGSKRYTQRTLSGELASPTSQPLETPPSSIGPAVVDNLVPTHHELNHENLKTYIYPTNMELREYQFNIVQRALFQNVLCALPTGLGKTFIASTVMLNWYRWTTKAKIIFMAPTRPLVAQQIHACLGITGIPKEDSCVLVGNNKIKPADRGELWEAKRVFFCTPQTVEKDLRKGLLDPKNVVCLVVDEAHRATGRYAYTQVVNLIHECNKSFRILALTATPSSSVDGVQTVLTNMMISRTEIRSEESIDIRRYVHKRDIKKLLVEPSEDQEEILELICQAAEPVVDEVRNSSFYPVSCARAVTQYGAVEANKKLAMSDFARNNRGAASRLFSLLSILIKFGVMTNLLQNQGIGQFFKKLKEMKEEATHDKDGKSKRPGKNIGQFMNSEGFIACYTKCEQLIQDRNFIGHAKLGHVVEIINDFFGHDSTTSRVIIFTDYRTSASEILRVLNRDCPNAKPHIFVGQQNSDANKKGKRAKKDATAEVEEAVEDEDHSTAGMKQNVQQEVIEDFKKGEINILVATSIGEEGLDIGEVDLIICYDQSASPIRSLQRMGRTGRKRQGRIYLLMTPQEERKSEQSMDQYRYLQRTITDHSRFEYLDGDRILPKKYTPECEKKVIEIPPSNLEVVGTSNEEEVISQLERATTTKSTRRPNKTKTPAKPSKRRLPDDAEEGFVPAGKLLRKAPAEEDDDPLEDMDTLRKRPRTITPKSAKAHKEPSLEVESGVLRDLFSPSPSQNSRPEEPASSPLNKEVIELESD
jgi:ATP-dependent DNA helicase MPH1